MARTYKTIQGDTWDLIAYELTVPDLPEEQDDDLPFWRNDGEVDE